MKYRILVTGSNGQLGKEIIDESLYNSNDVYYFSAKNNLDITDYKSLKNVVKNEKINLLINCAAYTNVSGSESFRKLADQVNADALKNISHICKSLKVKLIHFSTDYVFDGQNKTPYKETDTPNPLNYYGKSKLFGEKVILGSDLVNSIIIRVSYLYSMKSNKNLVNKIIKKFKDKKQFSVTLNSTISPTNANDLAKDIFKIIPKLKNKKTEVYHYANTGKCTILEFASEINKIFGYKYSILQLKTNNQRKVKRPLFSALDNNKIISDYDLKISNWKNSLTNSLQKQYDL